MSGASRPLISTQSLFDFIKDQTYGTMIDPPFTSQYDMQKGIIRAMMRHIEPLLMTMGYLDAHAEALHVREETHHETPTSIREKMLNLTPETLMSEFIPVLERGLEQLSIPFKISDIPGVQVLWQPLTIDPITGELCVDSSFNDKLIEANAQITEAILALNRLKRKHAPSPPSFRPSAVSDAPHSGLTVASISPRGRGVRPSELVRHPEEPVSPAHVPAYANGASAASAVLELESPPTSPMNVGPPIIRRRRSYAVVMHGDMLSTAWVKYPIESNLGKVSYTADCVGQSAPSVQQQIPLGGLGSIVLRGSEFIREDPNRHRDIIFGRTGEPCPRGQGWVGLNPMIFTCDAAEELAVDPMRALLEPEIGIWAFDADDDVIVGRRNVIDISQLKRLYNTDRSYGTYRLLFKLIYEDLEANPIQSACEINIVYHVCRTGSQQYDLADIVDKFVTYDGDDFGHMGRARPLYKYPNEARIVRVADLPPNYVMEMIGFNVPNQAVGMLPLGSRHVRHGLHFVLQGCFYNLMVYLGIISHRGGEILTSIQNEGITSKMFLNFVGLMNERRNGFTGLRPFDPSTSSFVVERLPIDLIQHAALVPTNGISKLLHVMIEISKIYQANMAQGRTPPPPPHAILVKLFHRRHREELVHEEQLGHWVAFVIDPNDFAQGVFPPWRFVDPQGLSIHTEHPPVGTPFSYTVPMSFKNLRSLDEMCLTLNEFVGKFSHIDLFYIALPPGQPPHSFTLPPDQVTNSVMPKGGKTKKRLNKRLKKSKSKSKTKSKSKSNHDKRISNRSSNLSSKRSSKRGSKRSKA
jgi:hypothetical protein